MTKRSAALLLTVALSGSALAQGAPGNDRFCQSYAANASGMGGLAIKKNPACLDFSRGVHGEFKMHFDWCMKTPASSVKGAEANIRRLVAECTGNAAKPAPASAPRAGGPGPQARPGQPPAAPNSSDYCEAYAKEIVSFNQRGKARTTCPDYQRANMDRSAHFRFCMASPRAKTEEARGIASAKLDGCLTSFGPDGGGAAPPPAAPQPRAALQFDKPSNIRKIPPKPGSNDPRDVTCTYFPDFMIRVVSDGPTAERAALVRGANPPCSANKLAGELIIDTPDMAFSGRKGGALFFFHMDSHGTSPFTVIDAQTGNVVINDGTKGGESGIASAAFEQGGLRLRYRRSFNASCSILQNAAGCWAKLVTEGLVPQDMAQQVPAPQICDAAYKKLKAPRDNPSIVLYQNDIVVFGDGKTQVLARGPVGCEPLP